jgi:hypothetical protein
VYLAAFVLACTFLLLFSYKNMSVGNRALVSFLQW